MSMPDHYPVTMIDRDGHEYLAFDASAYVTAFYSLGHTPKPAAVPAPAPVAKAAEPPAPRVAAVVPPKTDTTKSEPKTGA